MVHARIGTKMESTGISRWRQIGEALAHDMSTGLLAPGDKLPPVGSLAERFGVALQTMRRALLHLQSIGFLRIEHGRGTFVTDKALEYQIAPRTWFEENLLQNARTPARELLSLGPGRASDAIAERLAINAGDSVYVAVMIGKGDGVPLTLGRNYFPLDRLPKIACSFELSGKTSKVPSISAALKKAGIDTFRRKTMRLRARPGSQEEIFRLQLGAAEYIVETEVVSIDDAGIPILYSSMSYSSSRVEFIIGSEMFDRVR